MFRLFIALLCVCLVAASAMTTKVLVSGAGGRTGSLVFTKLMQASDFSPIGIIRRKKTGNALKKKFKDAELTVADVTNVDDLTKAIIDSKAEKYVLATSAVPKIKIWSLIKVRVVRRSRGGAPLSASVVRFQLTA